MKNTLRILVAFLLIINAIPSSGQLQKTVEGKWIKNWLLLGPIPLKTQTDPTKTWDHLAGFETDYLNKLGGENNSKPKAGEIVRMNKGSLTWKYYQSEDSVIDLVSSISKSAPVLAYAYAEVESDEATVKVIGLGTNDGGRLWVNGIRVWDYPASRGVKIDADLIPVLLKKGKNTLLLKVEQHGNKWGFCVRFHSFKAESALERGDLFKISTNESGNSEIASAYPEEVLNHLVQKLSFEVKDRAQRTILKEEKTTAFGTKLNFPSADYQPYQVTLKIALKSGEQLQRKIDFTSGKRIEYTLFSQGKSDYRISLEKDASESQKWAAKELQHWLKEISGVEIPILPFEHAFKGPQIALTSVTTSTEIADSYHYYNQGANIYISGDQQRGMMYGVFSFLERELGCRWYTPTVSVIPKRAELKFDYLDHSENPGVRVRNDFYFEAFDPTWAARNKMNGAMGYRDQPGGIESYWAVHTFYPLMPPTEFFPKHPEYYSLIDGKRTSDRAQLCLSNPEVLKIITQRIKERMRQSPEYLIYDVSQNDWFNPCQCEKCQAIVKEKGNESGLIIWFVNQVAEAVEKEFPDKFIGTLAYQYTRTPPKNINPRKNVVVRLCSIECCFAHDFKSCPENKSFLDDLKGWSAIAPHMYIWDYVVNFSHYVMPYPNFRVLQSNIQTFRDNHAIGIMEQAAYQSRGGEFSELRSYLISKLLWNPECNTEEVISDFMSGYYGRSGKFIRQYFDLLHQQITPETHIHLGLTPEDLLFSDDFVDKSCALFREAEKVADTDDVLRRVEMAYLPVLYLKCKRNPLLARQDGSYEKFCRTAEREGVTYYAEEGEPHRKAFHNKVENAR